MDPETRELVRKLHTDPDAPGSLDAVRSHLERIDQPKWLATVLDWWATKTRDRRGAGIATLESARLYGPIDPDRARAALQRAVENHADAPSFTAAVEACYPGNLDALASVLAHRNEALRVSDAHGTILGVAHREYFAALERRGHLEGHLEIVQAMAETDPEAKRVLDRLHRPAARPVQVEPPRQSFDDDLDAFLDDPGDDEERTLVAAAPDQAALMHGFEGDTNPVSPQRAPRPRAEMQARADSAWPSIDDKTETDGAEFAPPSRRRDPTERRKRKSPAIRPPSIRPPAPRPTPRPTPQKAARPAAVVPPEPLFQPAPAERAPAPLPRRAEPAPVQASPEPRPKAPEPVRAAAEAPAPAPEPAASIGFDPRTLRGFSDDYDEDDNSPMVGIDPRTVLVVGERASAGDLAVELVRFRGATCLSAQTLRAGALRSADFPGTIQISGGAAEIRIMDADDAVHVRSDDVRESVGGNGDVHLVVGDRLDVDRGPLRYSVRFGFSPETPTKSTNPFPIAAVSAGIFFALLAHITLAVGVDYLAESGMVNLEVEDRPQEEIFAEARLAPPPDTPPPPPRPRPRRVERTKAPPRETRTELPRTLRDRVRRLQNNEQRSDDATENLLQRLTTPNAGTGQTLQDVTTNIQAVEGGPLAGGVTVSGVQSALDGVTGVNTASQPGSSTVGSLGGTDAAGTTGMLTMRNTGTVRGRVRAVSALGRQTGGSLSRGEVQRVINSNIGRIQRCYERQLISNPGISGRVTFGWTIRPNGSVAGVREQTSTLGNSAVTSCIAGVIRRMRFPRPQGGAVTISYPFMFQRAP